MKVTPFYFIKSIDGNKTSFHRKASPFKKGVYFWGFNLSEDPSISPIKSNELIIYYIGKSERNIVERIMQEVTQLIFGGFGTIIDMKFLMRNPYKGRLFEKQQNNDIDVLYKADGLHVLYNFLTDKNIIQNLDYMRERFIFCWIEVDEINDIKKIENELHHIVRTNVFGIGNMKNRKPKKNVCDPNKTPYFNDKIDWSENKILKDWLINVNNNIK